MSQGPYLAVVVHDCFGGSISGVSDWELLYADDLVIVAESLKELAEKFQLWKLGMEVKGLECQHDKNQILVQSRKPKTTK